MNIRNLADRVRIEGNRVWKSLGPKQETRDYDDRLLTEQKFFSGCQTQNELPEIFHYWSNKFLRPKLERLGFAHPVAMFCHHFELAYIASSSPARRFLSVGAGGCQTEVRLAKHLVGRGLSDFAIECLELNPALLAEGNALARESGVSAHIITVEGDANKWTPTTTYDGVLANNSIHHILNLEGLFEEIEASLAPSGIFVTSDMIGRNGHMRWPEALSIVEEFWRELPKEYTYNHLLSRFEQPYDNWDCSGEGFEGIRAQDILPLLLKHFDFDLFVPFANVIDPFIERTFGPNFRESRPWDAAFIDRVHARDEAELARGAIKPTHILAAMCVGRPGKYVPTDGLSPRFFVRSPRRVPQPVRALHGDVANHGASPEPSSDVQVSNQPGRPPNIDLTVLPSNPKSFEPLVARIMSADRDIPQFLVASVRHDAVGVRIYLRPSPSNVYRQPGTIDVRLGQFPAGPLSVAVYEDPMSIPTTVVIDVSESVHAAGLLGPSVDYTDLWWNPSEPGWGMSIQQHSSDRLIAIWLVYDDSGRPTWYSLQPGSWSDPSTYAGPIYKYSGSDFASPYVPGQGDQEVAGEGTLAFSDFANGAFNYEIDQISGTKNIQRMEF